jgi:hypothetical protein
MSTVSIGNHAAVIVPRQERERIRRFYGDVLGAAITMELTGAADAQVGVKHVDGSRDHFRLGNDFYIAFMYGDIADESDFLRSGKSIYLELKSDKVDEMRRKIVDFGVKVLDVSDPHLYFQAPGGQVFRLVKINEDLSKYERDS